MSGLGVSRSGCLSPLEYGRSRSDVVKELRDLLLHHTKTSWGMFLTKPHWRMENYRRKETKYVKRCITEKRLDPMLHPNDALVKSGLPSRCQQIAEPVLKLHQQLPRPINRAPNPSPNLLTKIISL